MLLFAIAEDNERYARLLQKEVLLIPNSTTIILAKNGYELLLHLNKAKQLPTILLLDIEMPKIDGLLITSYLNLKYPSIKIIGVSTHSNKELAIEVLSEGAIGFISKHFLQKESAIYITTHGNKNIFLDSIESALIGESYIDKLVFNYDGNITYSKSTKTNRLDKVPQLNETLTEFLLLNAAELSFEEIASIMNKSKASIKHYSDQLSQLLEVKKRSEIITYCIKHGLVKLPSYYDKTTS